MTGAILEYISIIFSIQKQRGFDIVGHSIPFFNILYVIN